MDIQKIVREGNIKLARAILAQDYLNVPITTDAELIHRALTKLEQQGSLFSAEDFEAYQMIEINLDGIPPTDPLLPAFLARINAIEDLVKRPFPPRNQLNSPLKVEKNDRHKS